MRFESDPEVQDLRKQIQEITTEKSQYMDRNAALQAQADFAGDTIGDVLRLTCDTSDVIDDAVDRRDRLKQALAKLKETREQLEQELRGLEAEECLEEEV